ncbi:MAG: toll/interleukin-1 receptor domain-containing protein [Anaerolineae bacterium]|nr:toll/interleukin-1 receptor domain-containing protein [Anaerolineae bacterium]
MTYNSAAIRKLLQSALSDEDFNMLCYDYFRPVYDQFSTGMSRLQKTQRLIEYCERQGQLDTLLAEVEKINPSQYQQSAASIGVTNSNAATPSSSPVITHQPSASTADIQADKEIFVSYAWGGESEDVVNQLDKAFQDGGITIIRDKRDLGYRGRITEFMERIGRGKVVIVVISKKYLESENCMFELVQIAKNNQFYDRIFPIVLDDADIYKPIQRLKYVKYWEEQIAELDEGMKSVNSANLQGFREAIDQYTEIRAMIADLTNTLKDMNTLTVDMHREADFEQLIEAVKQKIAE